MSPLSRFPVRFAQLGAILACAAAILASPPPVRAQQVTVDLDPAATKIDFTLSATMHTVHGTFKLRSGRIQIDTATGKASGSIVVDATSAETANDSRDAKMHGEILESKMFPEVVFTPTSVKGPIRDVLTQQRSGQVDVMGSFRLHGQDHDAALTMSVQPASSGRVDVATQYGVPYVKWGLKNPSTFLLHVGDTVNLDIHASATISPSH